MPHGHSPHTSPCTTATSALYPLPNFVCRTQFTWKVYLAWITFFLYHSSQLFLFPNIFQTWKCLLWKESYTTKILTIEFSISIFIYMGFLKAFHSFIFLINFWMIHNIWPIKKKKEKSWEKQKYLKPVIVECKWCKFERPLIVIRASKFGIRKSYLTFLWLYNFNEQPFKRHNIPLPCSIVFHFLKSLNPFSNEISSRSIIYKTDKIKVYSDEAGVEYLDYRFSILFCIRIAQGLI